MNPSILTVIPARGGSKRIPRKNILPVEGKPLLAYTVEAALEAGVGGGVFVSTDDPEVAAVARRYGAEVIERPAAFADDTASTESALLHAVEHVQGWGNARPEHVLTLPPTSPLRGAATIRRFVAAYLALAGRCDALFSVTETRDDFWRGPPGGEVRRLFPEVPRRRQDREPLYIENSAMYLTRTAALAETNFILGRTRTTFLMDPVEAVDVNDPLDLEWVRFLIRSRAPAPGTSPVLSRP